MCALMATVLVGIIFCRIRHCMKISTLPLYTLVRSLLVPWQLTKTLFLGACIVCRILLVLMFAWWLYRVCMILLLRLSVLLRLSRSMKLPFALRFPVKGRAGRDCADGTGMRAAVFCVAVLGCVDWRVGFDSGVCSAYLDYRCCGLSASFA